MDWDISFSNQAQKFLERNHLNDEFALEPIRKSIRKLSGEIVAVDLRQLTGVWTGFYRARIRKIRIIFSLDFDLYRVLVEVIEYREGVYKKHR